MAKSTVKIGIIGAGMWGRQHIRACEEVAGAELLWLVDENEACLDQMRAEFKVPNATTRRAEMLADPNLDAVVVTTPPFTHAPIAVDVMKAGKHLLLEKPLAHSPKDVKAILAEARKHSDRVLMEASCRYSRLRPKAKVVRDLISKGKLGNVYHIHNQMMLRDTFVDHNPKGVWGVNKKLAGGGPFIDWGCYDISFHLGVLGDAPKLKSLKTYTWNGLRKVNAPVADVEQHGAALMEFDTGLTYYYERGAGAHCEVASETRILGTKGGLKFSYLPWDPNQIQFFSTDKKGAPTQEIIEVTAKQHPEFGNVPLMTHFLACIQGKATSLMPLELAAKHLDILWRILR